MKRLTAFLLVFMMILTLAACGKKKDETPKTDPAMEEAAGKYEGIHIKLVGADEWQEEEFSIELKADGTGTHNRDNSSYKITWTLDGEKFRMEETFIGDPIVYTGTLVDGVLDIFNGDPDDMWTYEYVYQK